MIPKIMHHVWLTKHDDPSDPVPDAGKAQKQLQEVRTRIDHLPTSSRLGSVKLPLTYTLARQVEKYPDYRHILWVNNERGVPRLVEFAKSLGMAIGVVADIETPYVELKSAINAFEIKGNGTAPNLIDAAKCLVLEQGGGIALDLNFLVEDKLPDEETTHQFICQGIFGENSFMASVSDSVVVKSILDRIDGVIREDNYHDHSVDDDGWADTGGLPVFQAFHDGILDAKKQYGLTVGHRPDSDIFELSAPMGINAILYNGKNIVIGRDVLAQSYFKLAAHKKAAEKLPKGRSNAPKYSSPSMPKAHFHPQLPGLAPSVSGVATQSLSKYAPGESLQVTSEHRPSLSSLTISDTVYGAVAIAALLKKLSEPIVSLGKTIRDRFFAYATEDTTKKTLDEANVEVTHVDLLCGELIEKIDKQRKEDISKIRDRRKNKLQLTDKIRKMASDLQSACIKFEKELKVFSDKKQLTVKTLEEIKMRTALFETALRDIEKLAYRTDQPKIWSGKVKQFCPPKLER